MSDSSPRKLSASIEDACYGLHYLAAEKKLLVPKSDSPYSAPGKILREIINRDEEAADRLTRPVHPDLEQWLSIEVGNPIIHIFGTWHLAEQCLKFGRIKYLNHPTDRPGSSTASLAQRLRYGDTTYDTLLEEFSLSAFFQTYFYEKGIWCDHLRNSSSAPRNIDTIHDAVLEHLNSSDAYQRYEREIDSRVADGKRREKRINADVIAYWVSGLGKPPEIEPETPDSHWQDVLQSDAYRSFSRIQGGMIKRVRALFFAPEAPLNLRHLDLVGRISWSRFRNLRKKREESGKTLPFSHSMLGFLSRLHLSDRYPEDSHLLPATPWKSRIPYYVPQENDYPNYRYLRHYVNGLQVVREGTKEGDGRSHSLCRAYGKVDSDGYRTGLLRLSLLRDNATSSDAEVLQSLIIDATDLPPVES